MEAPLRTSKDGKDFKMMRRIDALLMIGTVVICLLSGSVGAQQQGAGDQHQGSQRILIVHLSRTNNTKVIAEMIHPKVGGKLVALELEKPYPADYRTTVQQVVHENETGYLATPENKDRRYRTVKKT